LITENHIRMTGLIKASKQASERKKASDVRLMLARCLFSLILYGFALWLYPFVYIDVGYMYKLNLNFSVTTIGVGTACLVGLTAMSNARCASIRHSLDIGILGIFMPIAVMAVFLDSSTEWVLLSAASVAIIIKSARLASRWPVFCRLARVGGDVGSFRKAKLAVTLLFAGVVAAVLFSFRDSISFNIARTFVETYVIRSEAHTTGLLGYLVGWFPIVFFPFLLEAFGRRGGAIFLLAGAIGAVAVFQVLAIKITLLFFFPLLFLIYTYNKKGWLRDFGPYLLFLCIFLASAAFGKALNPFIDRFFYLVGLNSIYYFEFFSENPLRYFEGSRLDFGISAYGEPPGITIDRFFFDGLGTNQSGGFLPTIFSDFGYFGVILGSILIGLVIAFLATLPKAYGSYRYLVLVAFALTWMNSPITMTFLSHGLMFVILIVLMLKVSCAPRPERTTSEDACNSVAPSKR